MNYTYNPFTSNIDLFEKDAASEIGWTYELHTLRTTNGSGGAIFSIPIPELGLAFIEVVLKGKLENADEFYLELITYRAYNPGSGNVVQMSGTTTSLSENFTVNPTRTVTTSATNFVLSVGSGGVQDINWVAALRYHITTFNL